jgi:hypothetical protein
MAAADCPVAAAEVSSAVTKTTNSRYRKSSLQARCAASKYYRQMSGLRPPTANPGSGAVLFVAVAGQELSGGKMIEYETAENASRADAYAEPKAPQRTSRYQYLTDTNPDTRAGKLLRQYWQPVALTVDLPPGAPPLGVRRPLSRRRGRRRGVGPQMHSQIRRSCPRSHRKWWDTLPLSRLAIQYQRASA